MGEQRFELDVKGNGGEYRYTLVVDKLDSGPKFGVTIFQDGIDPGQLPSVRRETLEFNGKPLFRFDEGEVALFND